MENLSTPSQIIAYIGHERAAQAVGVPKSTVLRARWRDKLPAAWYFALCGASGRELPRGAFSFKVLQ